MHCEPDLHPLSLEDVLHIPGRHRSGADYYKRHLFIRVLSHTLHQGGEGKPNFLEQIARSSSPEPIELADEVEPLPKYSTEQSRSSSGFTYKFSRKFGLHKSATIEPGGYDVENVDVSKPPRDTNYGSFYATYVRPSLFVPPYICSFVPSRIKGKRLVKPSSNSCKNSGRVVGWMWTSSRFAFSFSKTVGQFFCHTLDHLPIQVDRHRHFHPP